MSTRTPLHLPAFQGPRLPAGIGSFMSTRHGGCSLAPWDSLNLGDHVGDDPGHVKQNRQRLTQALGAKAVFLRQVHGTDVLNISEDTQDGEHADACWTFSANVACTIMVADCLPVLMWDLNARWVAAAHAGWRGLAGEGGRGVLETLWSALQDKGALPGQTGVWLGPCIGPSAFEVGADVVQAFGEDATHAGRAAFQPARPGHWWADLQLLARIRLDRLGLSDVQGNDGSPAYCTSLSAGTFFSHRRDAVALGSTGRMAACIWRNKF